VAKRIRIRIGGIEAEAALLEDKAPKTVAAIWNAIPFTDRTVQVRWSGDAWRTQGRYEFFPKDTPVENLGGKLTKGDIIYYYTGDQNKVIGFCYGKAQWLAPYMVPVDVCVVGKIDKGLEDFSRVCERIIFDGPLTVMVDRL
jgi:hypothetical protein